MISIAEILGVLFGEVAKPVWVAQRYEAKADRVFKRWLRMSPDDKLGPRGERLIKLVAHYNLRAERYRKMI